MTRVSASAFVLAFALSCSLPEPETHLLPEGFRGRVWIIPEVPDGEVPEYRDARRVYRIPASGVLRTRFGHNGNTPDVRFFFENESDGSIDEIVGRSYSTIHDTPENRADDSVVIHAYGRGSAGARVEVGAAPPCRVAFIEYVVGRKRDIIGRLSPPIDEYLATHPVPCGG